MAANLKATMDKWNFSEILEPYSDWIGEFLSTRYPGSGQLSSKEWHTKYKNGSTTINQATYDALSLWARANCNEPFSRHMHICEKLFRGHVVYQPFTDSLSNSGILFRPRGVVTAVPGRIEAILQENTDSNTATGQARIMILARTFNQLSAGDAANDPYRNHPIVGTEGLNIMSLVYDSMDDSHVHIIEPEDLVSHIAVCRFVDSDSIMSADCAVIVDLDMKHFFDD
ncbi:hypothetical protein FRC12_005575 [Ceratobasidium sp. 428]|nr:hypothetical protein FRC12_005575 [Ceratobasidium sp. 428]